MSKYANEIEKRRTFAIISHPDAGKTTLTEKFLLYGGAINLAGSVKGKATARHAVQIVWQQNAVPADSKDKKTVAEPSQKHSSGEKNIH